MRRVLSVLLAVALLPGVCGVCLGWNACPKGINDSGGEFKDPLSDGGIHFSSPRILDYFASQGLDVVRLPFTLSSVMATPAGPFNRSALRSIHAYLAHAHEVGVGVILDLHSVRPMQGWNGDGRPLSVYDLALVWRRLAQEFRYDTGLYGYDLFNEPILPTVVWEKASQAAVNAIRGTGDRHLILVEGGNWASAQVWLMYHGYHAWIHDPAQNCVYEAHEYFDSTGGGRYPQTFSDELARDPQCRGRAARRLQVFVNWCEENSVRGFLGEVGCPDDADWLAELDAVLAGLQCSHMGWTYWTAGEAYPPAARLAIQPAARPAAQLEVLLHYVKEPEWVRHARDFGWGYRLVWRRSRYLIRNARDQFHAWRVALVKR